MKGDHMENRLSDRAQAAIRFALATRGSRKGLLLSSAPNGESDAFAAWSALMMRCNPYKVGMMNMIRLSWDPERKALHDEIDSWFESLPKNTQHSLTVGLDKDRLALQTLGVW
jgi:hypothetical protein